MPFLMSPLVYVVAFLLATNIIAGIGWKVSATHAQAADQKVVECRAKHAVFVEQTKAIGEIAKEKARIEKQENERIANETSNGWAAAIAVVRADAAQRVRLAAKRSAGGGSMPQVSKDRPGDAVPESDAIPSAERVAQDCAETTVTANFLQAYIERLERLSP
jgi:hypothetical protein